MIDDKELSALIREMDLGLSDTQIVKLQKRIDPFHVKKVSFSECVAFFTSESLSPDNEGDTIMDTLNATEKC